nr:hypothetical protein [Armatimonas sp.]
MAYFEDLTLYTYEQNPVWGDEITQAYPEALNIGWLDQEQPFPTSTEPPDPLLLRRLLAHTAHPVRLMLGFHQCHLCPHAPEDGARLRIRIGDRELFLDNGEVLVVGREGQAFRAPIMLYHYITVHYYRPPEIFGEALRESVPSAGEQVEAAAHPQRLAWAERLLQSVG